MRDYERAGPQAIVTAFELALEPPSAVIAIDVDSVMFPVNELVVLPALRHQGWDYQLADLTTFGYEYCLGSAAARQAYACLRSPTLYDGWGLTNAEDSTVRRLREMGRVIAVSTPMVQHIASKWAYCERAGFAPGDIVLTGDKGLVTFDVLIDDRPDTIMSLPEEQTIVFDRPWNREVQGRMRVHKFTDIPEAVEMLLER
jgi:5'(3')-deoxyribonucleotidase